MKNKKLDIKFSIILPAYNEEENIIRLIEEINNIEDLKIFTYEILVINDCSTDNTEKKIKELQKIYDNIILLTNSKNKGQSYSIYKGIKNSNYQVIVTMDADGQNNPNDIRILLNHYNYDRHKCLVGGIRRNRKDSFLKKKSSIIANKIRNIFFNDECDDTGCALKVFDKETFLIIPFFSSMHRFLPVFFKKLNCEMIFIPVSHRSRTYGKSKYGTFKRLFRGLFDLFYVNYLLKNLNK